MDTLGTANFGVVLLLYRRCPLLEVKLHWHGPVGTKQLFLNREVDYIMSSTQKAL